MSVLGTLIDAAMLCTACGTPMRVGCHCWDCKRCGRPEAACTCPRTRFQCPCGASTEVDPEDGDDDLYEPGTNVILADCPTCRDGSRTRRRCR